MTTSPAKIPADDNGRPFIDLTHSGLLWLINTTVLHPRGFALALAIRDGEAVGWNLLGDGTEPWVFTEHDAIWRFADVESTLDAARKPRPPHADLGATS